MSKSAILALSLSSFNIRPLTLWVTRPERHLKEILAHTRKHYSGDVLEKELVELQGSHQPLIDAQPKTVGELIKAYPYRYVHHRSHGRYGVIGLGKEPIAELKQKLRELGLTPDAWPALVAHDELLAHLSKPTILKMPAKEVFPTLEHYELTAFNRFFGWVNDQGEMDEKSKTRTIRDLIQFDPLNIPENAPNISPRRFFESRKRFFIALQQQLVKKGFTPRDGKFFKWNPTAPAFKKAQEILRKHNLPTLELRKFARIVVAERWII